MPARRKYWLIAAVFVAAAAGFAAVFLSDKPEFNQGPLGRWGWAIAVLINLVGVGVLISKAPKATRER